MARSGEGAVFEEAKMGEEEAAAEYLLGTEKVEEKPSQQTRRRLSTARVLLVVSTVFLLGLMIASVVASRWSRHLTTSAAATTILIRRPYAQNVLCVEAEVVGASGDVAFAYRVAGGERTRHWTWSTDKTLCRLRLKTRHEVHAYTLSPFELVASTEFVTDGIGISELDDAQPFATVTVGVPSFPLLTVQHIVGSLNETEWVGLLTLDREGYIVWYHEFNASLTSYAVFDQRKDLSLAVMREMTSIAPNSELQVIDPVSNDVVVSIPQEECANETFAQYSHEAKVVSSRHEMITFSYLNRDDFGTYESLEPLSSQMAKAWLQEHGSETPVQYLGDRLVRWDMASRTTEVVYDIFDYLNPIDNALTTSSYGWLDMRCSSTTAEGVLWSHASSASLGVEDDYLVTLRNLHMVLSLHRNGSGIKWGLASDESVWSGNENFPVFRIESPAAKFWEPHAIAPGSGPLEFFLIDDGMSRPGCTGATDTCFSRAVGYRLRPETLTAHLAFEFEYPDSAGDPDEVADDLYNSNGGYVASLVDDGVVVALTSVSVDENPDAGHPAYIFDVAPNATIRSKIHLPRVALTHKSGSYRAIPSYTVAGERDFRPQLWDVDHLQAPPVFDQALPV